MFDPEMTSSGTGLSADIHLASSPDSCPLDPHSETAVPGFLRTLPRLGSVAEARELVDKLLRRPPQYLQCEYDLDRLKFGDMRSSVLCSGVVALAVQAGHRAVICARSAHLPIAHWRAEFIFRAVSGIRLLRPELSPDEVLAVVTRAIHFCTSSVAEQPDVAAIH